MRLAAHRNIEIDFTVLPRSGKRTLPVSLLGQDEVIDVCS